MLFNYGKWYRTNFQMEINPFCGIQRTQDLSPNGFRHKPVSPVLQYIVEYPFRWVITFTVTLLLKVRSLKRSPRSLHFNSIIKKSIIPSKEYTLNCSALYLIEFRNDTQFIISYKLYGIRIRNWNKIGRTKFVQDNEDKPMIADVAKQSTA